MRLDAAAAVIRSLGLVGMIMMVMAGLTVDTADGSFPNNTRSLLCLLCDIDLIGPVNLVVGKDAVVEYEPAWPPPFAKVDPLVEDPRDATIEYIRHLDLSFMERHPDRREMVRDRRRLLIPEVINS